MSIWTGRVHNPSSTDIDGFTTVYKEAFGGPPYDEQYTDQEVHDIWDEHLANGRIVLAKDGEASSRVIGFGCSLPLHRAHSDVQEFLAECKDKGLLPDDFTPQNTWYMSELGVLRAYRGRKVAYRLVRDRLLDVSHINLGAGAGKYYVMRTALFNSNSAHLYLRSGAKVVRWIQDVSDTEQVTENKSQSTQRVYLFGESSEALHWITGRLDD